jgi:hypothetical protein
VICESVARSLCAGLLHWPCVGANMGYR